MGRETRAKGGENERERKKTEKEIDDKAWFLN